MFNAVTIPLVIFGVLVTVIPDETNSLFALIPIGYYLLIKFSIWFIDMDRADKDSKFDAKNITICKKCKHRFVRLGEISPQCRNCYATDPVTGKRFYKYCEYQNKSGNCMYFEPKNKEETNETPDIEKDTSWNGYVDVDNVKEIKTSKKGRKKVSKNSKRVSTKNNSK